MNTPNIDDVAQTLAEYERLAISSGAIVKIDPPEFSADGTTWLPIWLAAEPPVAGRATVHRDGIPTEVYATWNESLPVETSLAQDGRRWCDIWLAKPMQRFGSYLTRSALRRAYRDVIGDRIEADEDAPRVASADATARDWDTEILGATTEDAVTALHADMKRARAVTVEREGALQDRLELVRRTAPADAWATPAIRTETTVPDVAATTIAPPRPAPQDHLPPAENRATRRARKKGARR